MSTKVHKIVLCVVDHDDLGAAGIKEVIENTRYPNRCIRPSVVTIETREVEWSDGHPLNQSGRGRLAFDDLFRSGD